MTAKERTQHGDAGQRDDAGPRQGSWDFIMLLRTLPNFKYIWIAYFWNVPFCILGPWLTMGNWNCGKQNSKWGGQGGELLYSTKRQLRISQMEEMRRTRSGRGVALPCPLCSSTSQHLEALQTPLFRIFMEISLCRHRWLNCWPLVTEFNLQPLSPPWRFGGVEGGDVPKSSSHLITQIVPVATKLHQMSPHSSKFRYSWKGLILNNKRCSFFPYHSEIPRILGALC